MSNQNKASKTIDQANQVREKETRRNDVYTTSASADKKYPIVQSLPALDNETSILEGVTKATETYLIMVALTAASTFVGCYENKQVM